MDKSRSLTPIAYAMVFSTLIVSVACVLLFGSPAAIETMKAMLMILVGAYIVLAIFSNMP